MTRQGVCAKDVREWRGKLLIACVTLVCVLVYGYGVKLEFSI